VPDIYLTAALKADTADAQHGFGSACHAS